ncbi:hypothetical protein E2C01_090533 [Portunus trituberculatus]|uniref:Uncharacterized protein n=1 Tax=Portunus trituberculatus TaxID=210409 RepID=A0A5B7JM11_PORTR|nr:hypothetical protein [Portunus trituberculatus]
MQRRTSVATGGEETAGRVTPTTSPHHPCRPDGYRAPLAGGQGGSLCAAAEQHSGGGGQAPPSLFQGRSQGVYGGCDLMRRLRGAKRRPPRPYNCQSDTPLQIK